MRISVGTLVLVLLAALPRCRDSLAGGVEDDTADFGTLVPDLSSDGYARRITFDRVNNVLVATYDKGSETPLVVVRAAMTPFSRSNAELAIRAGMPTTTVGSWTVLDTAGWVVAGKTPPDDPPGVDRATRAAREANLRDGWRDMVGVPAIGDGVMLTFERWPGLEAADGSRWRALGVTRQFRQWIERFHRSPLEHFAATRTGFATAIRPAPAILGLYQDIISTPTIEFWSPDSPRFSKVRMTISHLEGDFRDPLLNHLMGIRLLPADDPWLVASEEVRIAPERDGWRGYEFLGWDSGKWGGRALFARGSWRIRLLPSTPDESSAAVADYSATLSAVLQSTDWAALGAVCDRLDGIAAVASARSVAAQDPEGASAILQEAKSLGSKIEPLPDDLKQIMMQYAGRPVVVVDSPSKDVVSKDLVVSFELHAKHMRRSDVLWCENLSLTRLEGDRFKFALRFASEGEHKVELRFTRTDGTKLDSQTVVVSVARN